MTSRAIFLIMISSTLLGSSRGADLFSGKFPTSIAFSNEVGRIQAQGELEELCQWLWWPKDALGKHIEEVEWTNCISIVLSQGRQPSLPLQPIQVEHLTFLLVGSKVSTTNRGEVALHPIIYKYHENLAIEVIEKSETIGTNLGIKSIWPAIPCKDPPSKMGLIVLRANGVTTCMPLRDILSVKKLEIFDRYPVENSFWNDPKAEQVIDRNILLSDLLGRFQERFGEEFSSQLRSTNPK